MQTGKKFNIVGVWQSGQMHWSPKPARKLYAGSNPAAPVQVVHYLLAIKWIAIPQSVRMRRISNKGYKSAYEFSLDELFPMELANQNKNNGCESLRSNGVASNQRQLYFKDVVKRIRGTLRD